jgi:hypothetical protein
MSWLAVKAFLGRIPRGVWIVLAVVILLGLGVRWYQGQIKAADRAGYARAERDIAAKALALKAKIDATTAKITAKLKERNDVETHRIAAVADDVRLRGPGKAACPRFARVPNAASGHSPPAREGSPAVGEVPDAGGADLIALPFSGTIALAEQHDKCRADILSYREWEKQLRETWPK